MSLDSTGKPSEMQIASGAAALMEAATTAATGGTSAASTAVSVGGAMSGPSSLAAKNAAAASFKLLLLVMMVLQNTSTVLVGRYTRAGVSAEDSYNVNHLILVSELSKFVLASALEYHATAGHLMQSFQDHVFNKPLDALKILIPSLLYLVQNTLLYVALANLTAPLFQVTYQGKLVTTALASVVMLQRKYNVQQWLCLCGLSVGVAVVVLGEQKGGPAKTTDNQNLFVGLVAVTIACLSSALAGVYFEKVLKKPEGKEPPASLWMRNIQMAFFSVVIAFMQGITQKPETATVATAAAAAVEKSYFHGFTFWAWILIALQAGGGLLVAAVIKYADNVLKGLATGVSVVVSSILSLMLFGTPLGMQFCMGATMILVSVYFFSNPLPTAITDLMNGSSKTSSSSSASPEPGRSGEHRDLLPK